MDNNWIDLAVEDADTSSAALSSSKRPFSESVTQTEKKTKKRKTKEKPSKQPPIGTIVCGIDVGLKNLAICVLEQAGDVTTGEVTRPKIRAWQNKNLYDDREGGKIIKYEASDRLIIRIRDYFDEVGRSLNDWKDVSQVGIESQAASTSAIKRAEAYIFCYFVYKHPHITVKTISASYKLKLDGMTHTKDETSSYAQRKKISIKYGREYMSRAPAECPYRHLLDPPLRKKKGEKRDETFKGDDLGDVKLMALHMLGLPITI